MSSTVLAMGPTTVGIFLNPGFGSTREFIKRVVCVDAPELLTHCSRYADPARARFETVEPTEMRWDPDASSDIGSPPNGRTAHRQKRRFSSTRPTRDVLHVVRILGHTPQGVRTFEICQIFGDIGFYQRYAPSLAHLADKL